MKRRYQAVKLLEIDASKLAESVRSQRIVFGVDVAKEDFFGAFINEQARVLLTIRWKSPKQVRELVGLLRKLPTTSLEVALEPSGTYGDALQVLLQRASIPVYQVSPKRCHDAAEVYDGVPSQHDAKAAAIIAKLHLDGASRPWRDATDQERELRAAVDLMSLYDEQFWALRNRLEARLARYWPELTQLLPLDSATLIGLLAECGSPAQVAADPEQAHRLARRIGRTLLAEDKVEQVLVSARETIGVPMTQPERHALMQLAREAQRAREAARSAKAEVERLSQEHAGIQLMARAVGKVTAAVLALSVGNADEYESAAAYVKSYGLNLKERSSGKHKGRLKITKRGPGRARRYLYMAVLRLIQHDATCAAWYRRKVARDGGKLKGKAIVALMRKITAALWHVARGTPFDARKLFDVRRLKLGEATVA
jgi:transposase